MLHPSSSLILTDIRNRLLAYLPDTLCSLQQRFPKTTVNSHVEKLKSVHSKLCQHTIRSNFSHCYWEIGGFYFSNNYLLCGVDPNVDLQKDFFLSKILLTKAIMNDTYNQTCFLPKEYLNLCFTIIDIHSHMFFDSMISLKMRILNKYFW